MSSFWRLFKNSQTPLTTSRGLAIDDTLAYSVAHHQSPPILHLYSFIPSVIVGKYQDIRSALKLDKCRERGIEFNRRSTGGGTVIMGPKVISLGLGINTDHPGLKGGMFGIFGSLSKALVLALQKLGIEAKFQPKNDLEVNGKKIAGLSAASDTGKGLLFHTSLLVDFDIPLMLDIMNTPMAKLSDKGYNCFSRRMTTIKEELGEEVPVNDVMDVVNRAFEETFQISFKEDEPDDFEKSQITRFIQERYTNQDWIFSHKHPRARMGIGRLKTKGGLLEIYLSLAGGSIESVVITGDFFSSSESIHKLESSLKWTSARPENIGKNLAQVWQDDMIHGIDIEILKQAILLAKDNQERL